MRSRENDTDSTVDPTHGSDSSVPGDTSSADTSADDTSTTTGGTVATGTGPDVTVPDGQQVIDFGSSKGPRDYDGFLVAAFEDIEKFWTTQFPATYGGTFTPLSGGIFAAYQSRREPIPGCGTARTTYEDIEGNAFYCGPGDFIVYDDDELMPELVDQLGQSAVGVVLAHEFGHAIQERAGEFDQPVILKEQQADCFAGAWAAHVARGEAPGLTFGDAEVKQGLIAMIKVRDPVNGNVNDPNAHGTGFDRVGAFQDGFNGGPARCKTFFTEGREGKLIDIPFNPGDVNGGNLPVVDGTGAGDDIATLIPEDLDRFWQAKLSTEGVSFTPPTLQLFQENGTHPTCAGVDDATFERNIVYCPSTNQILADQDFAVQLDTNELFGDLSVGSLIGEAYSEAVQTAQASQRTGKQRALLDDCYTGAWVADAIPDTADALARTRRRRPRLVGWRPRRGHHHRAEPQRHRRRRRAWHGIREDRGVPHRRPRRIGGLLHVVRTSRLDRCAFDVAVANHRSSH
ncbi:MAG: neutral zinc metallopeptidase [Ilumatobacteraceae bacterium]